MPEEATPRVVFKNFTPAKPSRPRQKELKHGEVLKGLTLKLVATYTDCSESFRYTLQQAPRRVLTKLAKGVHNQGYDNAEHDYICRVCDKIVNPDGNVYEITERLGHGTFGQVLKCVAGTPGDEDRHDKQPIALKIIKNKPAYFHQALVEVHILKMLNTEHDPEDKNRIVRMIDFFVYRKHLCIAFELLSVNLYDVLKQNQFRGVSMALIRVLTEQLLKAMMCLRQASVIHCDLKPENVLLSNMQHTRIKLIDFGSACFENHTVYSYIQSRFYRSPEVLLGLPYTTAIDMWSLGCICAELFLGLPIFPGHSEYDQLCRITEVCGKPPALMLDNGKMTKKFFRRIEEPLPATEGDAADCGSSDCPSYDSETVQQSGRSGRSGVQSSEEVLMAVKNKTQGSPRSDSNQETAPPAPPGLEDTAASAAKSSPDAADAAADAAKEDKDDASSGAGSETRKEGQGSSFIENLKRKVGLLPEVQAPAAPSSSGSACAGPDSEVGSARDGSAASTAPGTAPLGSTAEATPVDPKLQGHEGSQRPGSDNSRRMRRQHAAQRKFSWRLKQREEYERDEHKKEPIPKKYFDFKSLEQMVENLPYKSNASRRTKQEEFERRLCFLQFLKGVLEINPDQRWTPKQGAFQPFITGEAYRKDYRPVDDVPVPSFMSIIQGRNAPAPARGAGEIPKLAAEALSKAQGQTQGGGSARAYTEGKVEDGKAQPSSAPSSVRGAGEQAAKINADLKKDPNVVLPASQKQNTRGLWGHLCAGIPLPDDNPAESYRPPIEQLSEDFFKGKAAQEAQARAAARQKQEQPQAKSPQKGSNMGGSPATTPSSRNKMSSPATGPQTMGSPQTAAQLRPGPPGVFHPPQGPPGVFRPPQGHPGSAGTPPSAREQGHVSDLSEGPTSAYPGSSMQAGNVHPAAGKGARTASSGMSNMSNSRGSSPWHLPSPMTDMSTASERVNSSQPSGSDSCGENTMQDEGGSGIHEWSGTEDPSQSDGHRHQQSDSDGTMTPKSMDNQGDAQSKAPQMKLWDNINSQMKALGTSQDGMPRGVAHITQSPGTAGAMGNFREKMGMNESGPVIPSRREGNPTFTPPARTSEGGTNQQAQGPGSSQSGSGKRRDR